MSDIDISRVLSGWESEGVLGSGSFGTVYLIRRTEEENTAFAAAKVITVPPSAESVTNAENMGISIDLLSTYFSKFKNDLNWELTMYKTIQSPHLAPVEDLQVEDAEEPGFSAYIRTGIYTPLSVYFEKTQSTQDDAARMGREIASALEALGEYGMVHGDIKPENILVADSGAYVLGDYGIKRSLEKAGSVIFGDTGSEFDAPELSTDDKKYTAVCDVYSLGLLMAYVANGCKMPADKNVGNMQGLDKNLAEVIRKATAQDPTERYQSGAEMRAAMSKLGLGRKTPRRAMAAAASFDLVKKNGGAIRASAAAAAISSAAIAGLSTEQDKAPRSSGRKKKSGRKQSQNRNTGRDQNDKRSENAEALSEKATVPDGTSKADGATVITGTADESTVLIRETGDVSASLPQQGENISLWDEIVPDEKTVLPEQTVPTGEEIAVEKTVASPAVNGADKKAAEDKKPVRDNRSGDGQSKTVSKSKTTKRVRSGSRRRNSEDTIRKWIKPISAAAVIIVLFAVLIVMKPWEQNSVSDDKLNEHGTQSDDDGYGSGNDGYANGENNGETTLGDLLDRQDELNHDGTQSDDNSGQGADDGDEDEQSPTGAPDDSGDETEDSDISQDGSTGTGNDEPENGADTNDAAEPNNGTNTDGGTASNNGTGSNGNGGAGTTNSNGGTGTNGGTNSNGGTGTNGGTNSNGGTGTNSNAGSNGSTGTDTGTSSENPTDTGTSEEKGTRNDVLFPSDTTLITRTDLEGKTKEESAMMINEIYARHGKIFKSDSIQKYFESQSWYTPVSKDSNVILKSFSDTEIANMRFIVNYQKEMGYRNGTPSASYLEAIGKSGTDSSQPEQQEPDAPEDTESDNIENTSNAGNEETDEVTGDVNNEGTDEGTGDASADSGAADVGDTEEDGTEGNNA